MVNIRSEMTEDIDAIHAVVAAAFPTDSEAKLVDQIRVDGDVLISLVATVDNTVVGHVLVSPILINTQPPGRFAGLAPLSVQPDYQSQGIGGKLMQAAIANARELGIDALFLLGNPAYYARFGFTKSHVGNEYGATDAFMQLELSDGALVGVKGVAQYVDAFRDNG